jgi:hypothetical protein
MASSLSRLNDLGARALTAVFIGNTLVERLLCESAISALGRLRRFVNFRVWFYPRKMDTLPGDFIALNGSEPRS